MAFFLSFPLTFFFCLLHLLIPARVPWDQWLDNEARFLFPSCCNISRRAAEISFTYFLRARAQFPSAWPRVSNYSSCKNKSVLSFQTSGSAFPVPHNPFSQNNTRTDFKGPFSSPPPSTTSISVKWAGGNGENGNETTADVQQEKGEI